MRRRRTRWPSRPAGAGSPGCRWWSSGSRWRRGSPWLSNRCGDFAAHALRILRQVQPREPQHLPAEQRDLVLTFAVVLKVLLVTVKCPAVCLESELRLGKCHVDLVAADGVVGLPTGKAVVAQ